MILHTSLTQAHTVAQEVYREAGVMCFQAKSVEPLVAVAGLCARLQELVKQTLALEVSSGALQTITWRWRVLHVLCDNSVDFADASTAVLAHLPTRRLRLEPLLSQ